MTHVHASEEPSGSVERVSGNPIATQFLMVGPFALIPLFSFYRSSRPVVKKPQGLISLLGGVSETPFDGIRLRRLHWKSVLCAYLRSAAAAGAIFATLATVALLEGPSVWRSRENILALGSVISGMAAIAGCAYAWGRRVRPRNAAIRAGCAEVLGVAADLALADIATARFHGNSVELRILQVRDRKPWRELLLQPRELDRQLAGIASRYACALSW